MNRTIELSSGKVIDLNRFVALLPDEEAENQEYYLILEGCEKAMQRGLGGFPHERLHQEAIALDVTEAISVKEHLELKSNKNHNGVWDREEQLRKNQPAIELLKKRIARNQLMSDAESKQRAEFLANFQKTVDEQRVSERKLYSLE